MCSEALSLPLTPLLLGLWEANTSQQTYSTRKGFDIVRDFNPHVFEIRYGNQHSKNGSHLLFQKGLINRRKKSASTLSVRRYLQSGKPNYTHYTDEEALAQSSAFAWLQIQSESMAKLEINAGIMAMSSSPTSAQPQVAGHG